MSSATVKKRKCRLCHENGHTKADCPLAESSVLKDTSLETKKSGSHPVFVRVVKNAPPFSAHVVDLRQQPDRFCDVPVFQEKKVQKISRVEVNLSDMVKSANAPRRTKRERPPSFLRPTIQVTVAVPTQLPPRQKAPSFVPEPSHSSLDHVVREPIEVVEVSSPASEDYISPRLRFNFFQTSDGSAFFVRFVALFLLCILPFPAFAYYKEVRQDTNKVVDQTTTAFSSLQASTVAAFQANIPQAELDLNTALQAFSNAQALIEKEHKVIQYVAGLLPVVGKQVESRQLILQAGHNLALGNTYLVKGLKTATDEKNKNLIEKIQMVSLHLKSALPQYKEALVSLNKVKTIALPVEHQQSFEDFKLLFATFINDMEDISALSQSIQTIFGGDDFRRYLVLFQNNHELRASGGFVGSFAIIDVQKGKIMNIEVPGGGSYDLKGQLSVYKKPPAPLLLTNGRFEFQDANWWPDFPSSAKKMSEFYELARGASVDGVIAINATVLEKVLGVIGPLQNDKHEVTLSAQDALATLQHKVENDYDKQKNTPKAIIGDLFSDIRGNLNSLEVGKSLQLLTVAHDSLEQKDIQIYMKDEIVQKDLQSFGWTGEIVMVTSSQDYLMVTQTNLQGQKSDAKIEQTIEHQAIIDDDGSVIDTVIIRRKHNGQKGEEFYGAANISYMRIYVPQGAEIIDAGGFTYPPEEAFHVSEKWYTDDEQVLNLEQDIGVHAKTGTRIFQGFGKTIFGNWMITIPGEMTESYIVYKLPFSVAQKKQYEENHDWKQKLLGTEQKEFSSYQLFVQGQSGLSSNLMSSIIYKGGWNPSWVSKRDNTTLAQNGVEFNTKLTKQESIGVIMQKSNTSE